ncbi:MAG: hypothetical protein KC478_11790, partial [Bacteriovoracaceae bacterium]|nr:hypothetical protein [Bacteriovoracaceae bacterium]
MIEIITKKIVSLKLTFPHANFLFHITNVFGGRSFMSDNFPISHFFTTPNQSNNKDLNQESNLFGDRKSETSMMKSMLSSESLSDNKLTESQNSPSNQSTDFELEELKSITDEILSILKDSIQPHKFKAYFENTFTVSALG